MATAKISITVDAEMLQKARELGGANLSAFIAGAVEREVKRQMLIEFLDEMDEKYPPSAEGIAAGDKLWEEIVSFWTQEPSAPSPKRRSKAKR